MCCRDRTKIREGDKIFIKNYKLTDKSLWKARVDSTEDFSSFRWHQWVKTIDLRDGNLKPFQGKLGFAFLGYACDKGVVRNNGNTGAAEGPNSVRKKMSILPCHFTKHMALFDAGDVSSESSSLEDVQETLKEAVKRILDLNLFPILIGGGHDIAFGHYKGIFDYLDSKDQAGNIGIINFDAHFDLRPYPNGGTSGTMFNQIAEFAGDKNVNYSYLCLGILELANTLSLFDTANKLGAEYVLAKDIKKPDYSNVIRKIDKFIEKQDHIYLTVCSDVFSSAYAPGVSAPQPLGLEPERVVDLLEHILKSKKTISFDIAEITPKNDIKETTANLAANVIYSLVDTIYKNL